MDILEGCWLWEKPITQNGYGVFLFNNKSHSAHRVSYEYWKGTIPTDLEIDHLCRNKSCVNPTHLEAVTHKENVRRGLISTSPKITHCKRGHEFTSNNTYNRPRGTRECKTCWKIRPVLNYDKHLKSGREYKSWKRLARYARDLM